MTTTSASAMPEISPPAVICGDRLSACLCGKPAGHSDAHECADGERCGGVWERRESDHGPQVRILAFPIVADFMPVPGPWTEAW